MFSIENFYWILYQQLLKPSNLDCFYYYPFGSQEHLSVHEYSDPVPSRPHVLFYYDQEPIWQSDLGRPYEELSRISFSHKLPRLLANSEHSDLKRALCRDRSLLDWYFFYHGFAALDWYRDAQYVQPQYHVQDAFLSLNHLTTHYRSYRISLFARFIKRDLISQGSVSFYGSVDSISQELDDAHSYLSIDSKNIISGIVPRLGILPKRIDDVPVNGDLSARFGNSEMKLWQKSFLHVVNETVFYQPKLHLTEKIFKPVVSCRPFVLVAAPGNLALFKQYGFQTFDSWWNEDYDTIQDPDLRQEAIVEIVADLCRRTPRDLELMLKQMQPVLEHNKQHFFKNFKQIIVDEMIDNFDRCVRIWNNGRVDDRIIPHGSDRESVKKVLLR